MDWQEIAYLWHHREEASQKIKKVIERIRSKEDEGVSPLEFYKPR